MNKLVEPIICSSREAFDGYDVAGWLTEQEFGYRRVMPEGGELVYELYALPEGWRITTEDDYKWIYDAKGLFRADIWAEDHSLNIVEYE